MIAKEWATIYRTLPIADENVCSLCSFCCLVVLFLFFVCFDILLGLQQLEDTFVIC